MTTTLDWKARARCAVRSPRSAAACSTRRRTRDRHDLRECASKLASFFERVAVLNAHTTFALATVVARRAPVSSHLGDRAIVSPTGGWKDSSAARVRATSCGAKRLRDSRRKGAAGADSPRRAAHAMTSEPKSSSSRWAARPKAPSTSTSSRTFRRAPCSSLATRRSRQRLHLASALEVPSCGASCRQRAARFERARCRCGEIGLSGAIFTTSAQRGDWSPSSRPRGITTRRALATLLSGEPRVCRVAGQPQTRRSVRRLDEQAVTARLAAVRNPVGPISARGPGEVAVSILAEIVAASARSAFERDGGHHCGWHR